LANKRVLLIASMWAVVGVLAGNGYAQSPVPTEERFVLSGVVFVEGGKGVAWLQEPTLTKNQIVTVRPGDSIGAYRVTKILEDKVELEGPGGKFSVPLAGGSGGMTASPGPTPPAVATATQQPPIARPHEIIIPPGDPRGEFPGSMVLLGAGAQLTGGGPSKAKPQASEPPAAPPVGDVPVPASMQAPPRELPPHPALANPGATVIPRGDPRRDFPVSEMLPSTGR
jgi:hypothetical protein